jgi:hypothetical protein
MDWPRAGFVPLIEVSPLPLAIRMALGRSCVIVSFRQAGNFAASSRDNAVGRAASG